MNQQQDTSDSVRHLSDTSDTLPLSLTGGTSDYPTGPRLTGYERDLDIFVRCVSGSDPIDVATLYGISRGRINELNKRTARRLFHYDGRRYREPGSKAYERLYWQLYEPYSKTSWDWAILKYLRQNASTWAMMAKVEFERIQREKQNED